MYIISDSTVDGSMWDGDIPDLVGVALTDGLGGEEEGAALDNGKNNAGLSRAVEESTLLGAEPLVPLGTVIVDVCEVTAR